MGKGQQLSINFLVKFILAITMFSLGLLLVYSIFNMATDNAALPQDEFDRRITALCQSKEEICVGSTSLDITPGESYVMDVIIYNNLNEEFLNTDVTFDLLDSANNPSTAFDIRPRERTIALLARSQADLSFSIVTEKTTPKGSYSVRIAANRDHTVTGLKILKKRINLFIE